MLRPLVEYRFKRRLQRLRTPEELFTDYYLKNRWQNPESRSGIGSTLKYTENLREELPRLLRDLGIKSMLDAPCGDFNWFRHIALGEDVFYIGADIVAPLIVRNNELYGAPRRKFIVLTILREPLRDADFWMCRDCLFHFSFADVGTALNQLRKSTIRYFLTTTFSSCRENLNIPTGDYRPINLQLPPFNLPPPRLEIADGPDGDSSRTLALWERSALE